MQRLMTIPTLLVAAAALAACGGHKGDGGATQTDKTYTATVSGVDIVRSADGLDMAVTGLPAQGAELTVRQ